MARRRITLPRPEQQRTPRLTTAALANAASILLTGLLFSGPVFAKEPTTWQEQEGIGPTRTWRDAVPGQLSETTSSVTVRGGPPGTDLPLGGTNEPTIAVNPTNPLNIASASLWELRVSTDGGISFRPGVASLVPPTYLPNGDPSLAFDSSGRLFWTYIGSLSDGLSGDPGMWDLFIAQCDPSTGAILPGYPVNITESAGVPGATHGRADKEWLTADSHATSPFADRLYVAWTRFPFSGFTSILTTYSTDQGQTWSAALELASGTNSAFKHDVHNTVAPNGDVYLAYHRQPTVPPAGFDGRIALFRSIDGGATYSQVASPFPAGTADMTFNRQDQINTIPGAKFWLQGSVQPWVMADPIAPGRLYVVANDDPDGNLASGDPADVFIAISTNSGASWGPPMRIDGGPGTTFQVMPTAAIDPVSGAITVHYYDNRGGAVNAGGDYLLDVRATVSTDGGVSFSGDFRINNASFDPDAGAPCRFGCAPPLFGVWASSPTDARAVGAGGSILRYDGTNWSSESSGTGATLYGVWGVGGGVLFAVGTGGTILRRDGGVWSPETSGTSAILGDAWGSSATDVFAVGVGGTILHYDGLGWTSQASGTSVTLYGVWGSAPNDVWAFGQAGTILHYDGNGWSQDTSGTTSHLTDAWGSGPSDVYAVGFEGTILHYDGSGWSRVVLDITETLKGVWGSASSDVFVGGSNGQILRYDGSNWIRENTPAGLVFGISGTSGSDVFAVDLNGSILHYDGVQWAQEIPTVSSAPTLRIGEYNGVAMGGGSSYAVWCGNRLDNQGFPVGQQVLFDSFASEVPVGVPPVLAAARSGTWLAQNRPNPFSAATEITYSVPERGASDFSRLSIYDSSGRLVRTLLEARPSAGPRSVTWDGTDQGGAPVAAGVYFYQLTCGRDSKTKRMVLLK
jgi:hypothetical protein